MIALHGCCCCSPQAFQGRVREIQSLHLQNLPEHHHQGLLPDRQSHSRCSIRWLHACKLQLPIYHPFPKLLLFFPHVLIYTLMCAHLTACPCMCVHAYIHLPLFLVGFLFLFHPKDFRLREWRMYICLGSNFRQSQRVVNCRFLYACMNNFRHVHTKNCALQLMHVFVSMDAEVLGKLTA